VIAKETKDITELNARIEKDKKNFGGALSILLFLNLSASKP